MNSRKASRTLTFLNLILLAALCEAAEPAGRPAFQYKSEGIEVPAATADEPKAASFGAETVRAARKYLDDGAHHWVREKSCIACHSTGTYMAERPVLTPLLGKPSEEVLADFIENIPKPDAQDDINSYTSVWRSAGLASWDQHVTRKLSDHTAVSLQRTMSRLEPEGFFKTYSEVEIPYITTHFELTVQAARAVVTAPGWLANLKDAGTLERIARMKKFLAAHEPVNDYELALQLRLAALMPELVPPAQRDAATAMLWRLQQPDGGWSTRRMSPVMKWHETVDAKTVAMIEGEPDAANPASDAYMTGFAIILLRESGVPASDPRVQKGVAWLKQNQRVSGRWWMKSLYRDTYHFSTYISTAQALRALALCDEVPRLTDTFTGETEQFYYRIAPAGPYIDSQRGSKAFGFGDGRIFLSEDNAKTWVHRAEFADADKITFSVILKNGNILFATSAQLFLSTDNLKTHHAITVKRADGSDYLPHKPVNPAMPGWYFHARDGEHCFEVEGKEMLVWGNYCNVTGGEVPVNIYYSTDSGETVKLAYSFGRNKHFQQPGAAASSPLLGDPANKVLARHVHNVTWNPVEKAFYACTGDIDRGDGDECHWLRGTYDAIGDSWDWKVIVSVNSNSRFKCGGINFVDGRLYWISDANGQTIRGTYDRGIFSCAPADIADKEKHTLLFNPGFESANMIIEDGVMIATHCAPASTYACGIIYSPDMGKTWAQYDLKEFGPRSGCRLHKKNGDGWFRLDLRKGWIDRAEVIFIKPKTP